MIYLLGGTPKSGKTLVANKILKEFGIAFFQTDYLMMGLNLDPRIGVDSNSSDLLVANLLEPLLIKMITAMVENKETYLIEGVHLMPVLIRKLKDKFPLDIIGCEMGYTEIKREDKIQEIWDNDDKINNGWYHELSKIEFMELMDRMILESKYIKDEANKYDIKYFEIKNIINDQDKICQFFKLKK